MPVELESELTPGTGTVVVLGPTLGTSRSLWDETAAELRMPLLRFDLPGQGDGSPVDDPFTMADLADAVVGLADRHGLERFAYVGISLTGSLGIELALRHPDRLVSLGLFAANSGGGDPAMWDARIAQVRELGTQSLVDATSQRWFTPQTLAEHPDTARRALADLAGCDDASYVRLVEALRDFDRTVDLGGIRTPTFTVSGGQDPVATPAAMAAIAAAIPGALSYDVPDAAHLIPVAQPALAATIIEEGTALFRR